MEFLVFAGLSRLKNPYNEIFLRKGRVRSVVKGTSLTTVIGEVRINNLRVRRFADAEAVRTIGLVWAEK